MMLSYRTILLATLNKHKLEEVNSFIENQGLSDRIILQGVWNKLGSFPEESGSSFDENALIKARYLKQKFPDQAVLADDSGLQVFSLGGSPGVRSSRYSELGTDEANCKKLLDEMSCFSEEKDRQARFCCSLAFIDENDLVSIYHGYCYGRILTSPVGDQGFGYDPIFYIPELGKTLAQISLEEKNKISHRSCALRSWLESVM